MPFNTPLPAENTDPWYAPLVTVWSALTAFLNALETALAGKASSSDLSNGLLGFSYAATQSDWDTVKSYGKPTWAAVIPDQASADAVRAKGAGLLMVKDVLNVKARSPINT